MACSIYKEENRIFCIGIKRFCFPLKASNQPTCNKLTSLCSGRFFCILRVSTICGIKLGGRFDIYLLDTLRNNLNHCVGMASNMIGVRKNVIVVSAGSFQFSMINPVITKKSGAYKTEEGCLSLEGVRTCIRYHEIEVDYFDQSFKKRHGKYTGSIAQIIQHEIDHCDGIVI